jgi:hypothetical protein
LYSADPRGSVPGGGISPNGQRWVSCRPGFFLPLRERSGRLGGVLDREAVITITVKRLKLITTTARCHTPGGRHSRSIEKRECAAADAIFKRTQVKESD